MVKSAWESKQGPVVFIAIPNKGTVDSLWAARFAELLRASPPCHVKMSEAPVVDWARNVLVEDFLTNFEDTDWLFFLDSDVLPPPDAIQKLMAKNLPIVSGLYRARNPAFSQDSHGWPIVAGRFVKEKHDNREDLRVQEFGEFRPGEVFAVDAVGMGCVLIHRKVFEKIIPPWFFYSIRYEHVKDTDAYQREDWISEDWYFFKKVKEAGFPVYLDTTVCCGHQTLVEITWDGHIKGKGGYMDQGRLQK